MPIMSCSLPDGRSGFKWGHQGHCYADRADAEKQAAAAHANGYTGDMALDSNRTYDADGRLHIAKSHISKAAVNPYFGREIPNYEALGLEPGRIYNLLRHPDELAKAAPTFARLPILSKHIPISADAHPEELVVGSLGSDISFTNPYLDGDVCIWTTDAIAGIETNSVREFSCAYRYIPVMTPGEYEGESYDGIMTQLIGNHLALVEAGRAGSDVLAADSKPEPLQMKKTKLGNALCVALQAASPKLAQDSALPSLVGGLTKKSLTSTKEEVIKKLLAQDSDLTREKITVVMDAIADMEDDKPAQDEEEDDEEAKKKKKLAEDEEEEEREKKNKTAMDSFKKELREADAARRAVEPVVGVVAMDTADEIYGFALDHLKVDRTGVTGAGLKALFSLAAKHQAETENPAPRIAVDHAGSAAAFKQFPHLSRFRQA